MLNISLRPWKPASRPASRPALKPASRLASSLKAHPRGLEACLEACLKGCFMLKNILSRVWKPASRPASRPASKPVWRLASCYNQSSKPWRPRSLPGSLLDADKHIYFRCFEASMRPSLCASCDLKFYKHHNFPLLPTATPSPFPWDSNNSII